ncbi:Uncharacterised protein [Providencia rustigianii]|uniref:Uncharacterized protein n=1 Tax=Providencia rustigianii TaxID=158850 RepID=A0A379G622_9GAMM|nr:Uncharacterised protein [Providencia rustigianii]VEB70939.1 Uncharacterised protein [Providencia rustigianii]
MDMKISVFFALSIINVILFLCMNKKKIKTIKYRFCILYFYFMALPCGNIYYSMKSGTLPPSLSLVILATIIIIMNAIFITIKE